MVQPLPVARADWQRAPGGVGNGVLSPQLEESAKAAVLQANRSHGDPGAVQKSVSADKVVGQEGEMSATYVSKAFLARIGMISIIIWGVNLLGGCGSSAKIEGKVTDIFGDPIPGVEVKIDGSGFISKTDEDGWYSLNYAPGKIKIIFRKDGFTTHSMSLDIQQEVAFPAENVSLYPIPKELGLFYVDFANKKIVRLEKGGTVGIGNARNTFFRIIRDNEDIYTVVTEPTPIFLKNTSESFGFATAKNNSDEKKELEIIGISGAPWQKVGEQARHLWMTQVATFKQVSNCYAWYEVDVARVKSGGGAHRIPSDTWEVGGAAYLIKIQESASKTEKMSKM